MNSLEFINIEIAKIKRDYKKHIRFGQTNFAIADEKHLKHLQQIKTELEAWEDKKTPKKLKSKTDKDGRLLWVCPNCGDVYMKFWSDVETITCRKYCDECGQKLDWSENE